MRAIFDRVPPNLVGRAAMKADEEALGDLKLYRVPERVTVADQRRLARSTSPTLAAICATLNGLGMKCMPSMSISRRSCSSA